jgi:hypothetical protein
MSEFDLTDFEQREIKSKAVSDPKDVYKYEKEIIALEKKLDYYGVWWVAGLCLVMICPTGLLIVEYFSIYYSTPCL